ncbi:MAG: hypothetical protein KJP00_13930 [Bacteroidia bacterium]|nr:hypothetical protein [Bacteroidia bacterium]
MKKALTTIAIVLLVLVIGLFASAEIFEDKIGKSVQDSLNASLKTKFDFETFDLSLVRSFPNAAIRFQNISLMDLAGDSLLTAKKAKINLNLFSLLRSEIEFLSVDIEDGALNIIVDSKGQRNYDIWHKSAKGSNPSTLSINEAKIKNIEINYVDRPNKSHAVMIADDLLLSLNFDDIIEFDALGILHSEKVNVNKNAYLIGKKLSINSGIAYNTSEQILNFKNGEVGVDGLVFHADGSIDFNGDHQLYDLVLTNTNGSLEAIFGLLPKDQVESFKKITSSGNFNLTVFYKGKQAKYSNPALQADLSYSRGRIVVPQIDVPLKNVSFAAKYIDSSKKGLSDAQVQINAFKGTMDGERITGNFAYDNFKTPYIKLDAKGKMPITTLLEIFNVPSNNTNGNIDFNELVINGKLEHLATPLHQSNTLSKVDVALDKISFEINDQTILIRDGRLAGKEDYFELQGLELRTPNSAFVLNGYLKRLVPFLFAEFQKPDLQFDLDVHSHTCDVAEILDIFNGYRNVTKAATQKVVSSSTSSYLSFMNGDIDITIDNFEHHDIEGSDFKGHLSFINNNIGIKGTSKGMQGVFDLEGILTGLEQGNRLQSKLVCKNIDVQTFFKQSHNFGQQTLQSKHLEGNLNARLLIDADWDSEGNFNQKGLKVVGSAKITDGELINFEMMDNFSKYIKSEDLRHIKFGSLDNYFEIDNRVIYIPAMFIQSNAANLTLSGEHSFDNVIDYNIKVNAGQVLTNKLKKYNSRLSPIPARKRGFFNLYFSIDGTIENPSYRTAKRQVKSDFVKSEYLKEKIRLQLQKSFPSQPELNINTSPIETEDKNLQFEESEQEFLDPIEGKNGN